MGSLVGFVLSLNLKRRHLTSSQKAVVALEVKPHLEKEAAERQKQAGGDRKSEHYKSLPQIIGEPISDEPETFEDPPLDYPYQFDFEQDPKEEAEEAQPEPDVPPLKAVKEPPISKPVPVVDKPKLVIPPQPKPPPVEPPKPVIDHAARHANESTAQAAAMTGTNRQYVKDAENIQAKAPELLEEIKQGNLTIPAAKQIIRK